MPHLLFRPIWRLARGEYFNLVRRVWVGRGGRKSLESCFLKKDSFAELSEWFSAILMTGDGRNLSLYVLKDWMPSSDAQHLRDRINVN